MSIFWRKHIILLILSGVLFMATLMLPPSHAGAAECANGETSPTISANIPQSDKDEAAASFCSSRGGLASAQNTGSEITGSGCAATGSFFGLPVWYKYLERVDTRNEATGLNECLVKMQGLGDIWLIVAAVIEILLRVAALVATGFIIYGGITYILSQGSPEKTKQALQTTINAVVGLVIAIVASAVVSFIANGFN